jgi:hypothetical protein
MDADDGTILEDVFEFVVGMDLSSFDDTCQLFES